MEIARIVAAPLKVGSPLGGAGARRAGAYEGSDAVNTLARYREFSGRGGAYGGPWPSALCLAFAGDGSWGVGVTDHAGPVVPLINDCLAPLLVGENALATERLWDMAFRHAALFGAGGVTGCAIAAIDLALWDLKGRLLGRPVWELLGGPAHESVFCYGTGQDAGRLLELGFEAAKVAIPLGEAQGAAAIDAAEALVAGARESIGPGRELMLDCWPVSDGEFTVRLAERLRPYRLKWLEDFLHPDDFAGLEDVRRRLPWQTLAAGERWAHHLPFGEAAKRRTLDVLQPDVRWTGGATACVKIGHIAEGAGLQVALHGGANDAYGQHLCYAMPANLWGEFLLDPAPGAGLEGGWRATPGMALPGRGRLVPGDAPGFGIEATLDELEAMAG